ncbi:hypothetical protein CDAR_481941 [Caerostris darwini]|uniref:Uncharacterized protein n=1 Tax=Caerostris darwini TaxID=1538125 RepID=A0AAV4QRZ5_9ARAC|nr:hypothetical protein CDAR_481941 [Caerostris darwini]
MLPKGLPADKGSRLSSLSGSLIFPLPRNGPVKRTGHMNHRELTVKRDKGGPFYRYGGRPIEKWRELSEIGIFSFHASAIATLTRKYPTILTHRATVASYQLLDFTSRYSSITQCKYNVKLTPGEQKQWYMTTDFKQIICLIADHLVDDHHTVNDRHLVRLGHVTQKNDLALE